MQPHLTDDDIKALRHSDSNPVIDALSRFRTIRPTTWLPASFPFPDGTLPTGKAAFAAVPTANLIEAIAVRGPLHAIDGWSYLGRALSSLISGQAHSARHLSYYAELRAALSILASSGIGVFNKRNAALDGSGAVHFMSSIPTHQMAWLALREWSTGLSRIERLIDPLRLAGISLLHHFREFFPAHILTSANNLMINWGFDLHQGAIDRDERNWSSYQPNALLPMQTSPGQDAEFLRMFWRLFRPDGNELERHLLRILLETEARHHGSELHEYSYRYDRLNELTKIIIPFEFLTREAEPHDHDFIIELSRRSLPATPYSMISRAGLLLKIATGLAEQNLRAAGVEPIESFGNWWQEFGVCHGLWEPSSAPMASSHLWEDISVALEDSAEAPTSYRHSWISGLGNNAMRVCQTERVALWELFQ